METQKLVIPGITDETTLACIARARRFGQFCQAVKDAREGRCPFCQIDRDYNKIVGETEHCLAFHARPSERNTRLHFLIVPRRHVVSIDELTDEELLAIMRMKRTLSTAFDFKSSGILIRDGDARFLAGTVAHLHVHVMVPQGTGRVESPFFKGADDEATSLARAHAFKKILGGTRVDELSDKERELVKDRLD